MDQTRPQRSRPQPTLAQLKESYLKYLYGIIFRHPSEANYWLLVNCLFKIPFYWSVPNDDNRAEDGKVFRNDFSLAWFNTFYIWWEEECTVLEMLVGLANRMEDVLENPMKPERLGDWFILLISNLGFKTFTDENWSSDKECLIHERIDILLKRQYDPSGAGGLFPLEERRVKDQRKVEIWYQMMSYIDESFDI